MAKNILVVDDEKRILSLLEAYLEQQGFLVTTATNGKEAIFIARHEKPDLIILDIMMPEMDGYEFMRQHRKERETPIILLTAKVEEDDKVIGLELGADDYVTKPFSPRELTSRVRAVLRRTGQSLPQAEILRRGDVTLDRDSHLVTVDNSVVDLTPSEFDLLAVLMSSPGRTFTRLDLLDQIQDTAFVGYARTIDVHIKNLRAKLEDNPRQPRYIETVYGVGYRFTAR
ncbi:MAG: response regulator transcription factor [Chloroflexi bacterium]|nr:response regulator transcription factor [Chloroflexota bacterium]